VEAPWARQTHLVGLAYTVAFSSLLIDFGRAGDLFGRRSVLLTGLAVFTVASLSACLAAELRQLFAARSVQGIGAATVFSNALAAINDRFDEGQDRNAALGLWVMVGSGRCDRGSATCRRDHRVRGVAVDLLDQPPDRGRHRWDTRPTRRP